MTDRVQGKRIAYAYVIPGERAGTITVTLDATELGSEVEVVYDLTPLTAPGAHHLRPWCPSGRTQCTIDSRL